MSDQWANKLRASGIYPIKIPLPFDLPDHVMVYVLPGKRPTLIDTPLLHQSSLDALDQGLLTLGLERRALAQIILTHGHVDHAGAASVIAEDANCPVYAHSQAAIRLLTSNVEKRRQDRLDRAETYTRLGIPTHVIERIAASWQKSEPYLRRIASITELDQRDTIVAGDRELRLIHTPGHTGDSMMLVDDAVNAAFTADTLLPTIGAKTSIAARPDASGRPCGMLETYLESLKKIEAVNPEIILPGHGQPHPHALRLINTIRRYVKRKKDRLAQRLPADPIRPAGLTLADPEKMIPLHFLFSVSETMGLLWQLVDEHVARMWTDDTGHWWVARK